MTRHSKKDEAWSFIAGKNKTGNVVSIPNLRQIAHDLLTQHQLLRGWKTIKAVGIARRMTLLRNAICRKNKHQPLF